MPRRSCSYALSPTTATYNKDAADGTFAVTAPTDCSWTATSNASWVTFTAGDRGAGNGNVSYRVARNLDTTERTAAISVADQTFTVRQAGDTGGCRYSVAPVDVNLCMAGGNVTTTVTTQPNCSWTASPDASWLNVSSGSSGTGTGVVTVTVPSNYDAPRTGTIQVRWPTPTLGQNVRIAQAGCRYAVSKTAIGFAAVGGSGTFDVIQQSDPTECGGATQDRCVLVGDCRCPVDHDHEQHAAVGRQPGRVHRARECRRGRSRRHHHRSRQGRADHAGREVSRASRTRADRRHGACWFEQ